MSMPHNSEAEAEADVEAEVIWFRDPKGLLSADRIAHFIPERVSSLTSRLNALVRLSIYSSIVLVLFRRYSAAIYVPLGTMAFTYVMYTQDALHSSVTEGIQADRHEGDTREGRPCTIPTHSNPFMNVLMNEYDTKPDRPVACNLNAAATKDSAESFFEDNLFRDVDDVFGRRTSSRPFYTMPNTLIPNDQGGFARWCYETGPTCKERNGAQCFKNVNTTIL